MKNPWTRLSSRVAYKNKWIQVREDQVIRPDGKKGIYAVVEFKPSVFIVALTGDKQIYFVELFRYTSDRVSLEIPAGSTDGQDELAAAKRELQEETGLTAKQWQKLGELDVHNGACSEVMHVFLATNLKLTTEHRQKDDGISRTVVMSVADAKQAMIDGTIRDSQTLAALALALPIIEL